ncbi:MAG: HypC/HybG/HupF family hydrogenase formation chaperone [Acidobacteriia bacterium]|nr:HypC/HybG/HupF family hydrogenase formation chaperone [Terriglobia bacterium]
MCLAVPGKIVEESTVRKNRLGIVQFGGTKRPVFLDLVPEAHTGDYVLVHVGFAISKVDEDEAERTYKLLEKTGQLEDELNLAEFEAETELTSMVRRKPQ